MKYPKWLLGQKVAVNASTMIGTVTKIAQRTGAWHVQLHHNHAWFRFDAVTTLTPAEYDELRRFDIRERLRRAGDGL